MATTYLKRLPASNGSNTTGTLSAWIKREAIGSAQCAALAGQEGTDANNRLFFGFWSDDTLALQIVNGGTAYEQSSVAVFRDPSAWYHIVARLDTSNGVAQDRIKLYVNGTQITTYTTNDTFPSSVDIKLFENTTSCETLVGARKSGASYNNISGGSMSHVHVIDGTAYDASTFGETDAISGIWKIKTSPTVTYGTNGFNLKFEDRSNLDLDSGTNAFTNFTTAGTLTANYDNPDNNFDTMNPLRPNSLSQTYSNGNNTFIRTGSAGQMNGTMGITKGKWYYECLIDSVRQYIGWTAGNLAGQATSCDTAGCYFYGFYTTDVGNLSTYKNGVWASETGYTLMAASQVISIALDLDNGEMYYGTNGTWGNSSDPAARTNPALTSIPATSIMMPSISYGDSDSSTIKLNFGNGYFGTTSSGTTEADDAGLGQFKYDVPAGFYSLCTKNIEVYG